MKPLSARFLSSRAAAIVLAIFSILCRADAQSPWPVDKANAWQDRHTWLVGCNFTPSTAINQLEMWQADTFDPATIDRELGWAQQIGFTSVRVFLHNLLWQQDSKGFLKRIDKFLALAHQHHIGVTFVIFDSCWNPYPKLGKQPDPTPFTHNSGWVQSPGQEILDHPERYVELKAYVQGVIGHFKNDSRIDLWDVFNEPDNMNDPAYNKLESPVKRDFALILLQDTFAWAREMNPSQPLTSGVWLGPWADPKKLSAMERVQLQNSDVISFHNYDRLPTLRKCVENLRRYQRPIVCTEYMARPVGSTFDPNLKYLHDQHVAAYNWGFVSGKTQTIYPWDSWTKTYTAEPPLWFHDIFRNDGSPYDSKEVSYIKSVTAEK
ncbi:MAG TPA: 1,4-beta-xylanase [Verrucomicrobiae bacterium]|nr:1,4-beta-xylanase [Verrucomicrobiae bacterium]